MTFIPEIQGPGGGSDFHDSSLIDFSISPCLNMIKIVISTPNEFLIEKLWLIECKGVLRLEYETLGDGEDSGNVAPLEIYEIYSDKSSDEWQRWSNRLKSLGFSASKATSIYHLVLASSFIRGWGDKEYIEGINIICRNVTIKPAPKSYRGLEYSRPRIDANNQ